MDAAQAQRELREWSRAMRRGQYPAVGQQDTAAIGDATVAQNAQRRLVGELVLAGSLAADDALVADLIIVEDVIIDCKTEWLDGTVGRDLKWRRFLFKCSQFRCLNMTHR